MIQAERICEIKSIGVLSGFTLNRLIKRRQKQCADPVLNNSISRLGMVEVRPHDNRIFGTAWKHANYIWQF